MAIPLTEASVHTEESNKNGLILTAAVFVGGIAFTAALQAPTPAVIGFYTDNLTGPDQCLNGTIYDPSKGAVPNEGESNSEGHPTVVVTPSAAGASDMTLLFEGNLGDTSHFFTFVDGDETARALFEKCLAD